MVWLHGGGYVTGSGSSNGYDGSRLAERGDVVVVTLNHRLNGLGYSYLAGLSDDPKYADSGNLGSLDIVKALEWVRDHADEIGGDAGSRPRGCSSAPSPNRVRCRWPVSRRVWPRRWQRI